MSILMLGISHKHAALPVREAFAFSEEEQRGILEALKEKRIAEEAVLLCTCNRMELYVYGEDSASEREIFLKLKNLLLSRAKGEDKKALSGYFRFYREEKAVEHLFSVVCGLDSMVIGEDQILGQVKQAWEYAHAGGFCGTYLEALFRFAVTAAKKVKTETGLSRTPVSTASLAVHAAREAFPDLPVRNILVIGASGKIGSIVVKNLLSAGCEHIFMTVRSHTVPALEDEKCCTCIPYDDRYAVLEKMDVIISATSSPHFTLTSGKMEASMKDRRRVLVDLAVPMDVEFDRELFPETLYYNIDDFTRTARENNRKKEKEALAAGTILEEYEQDFGRWYVFQKNRKVMEAAREVFLEDVSLKGPEKAFDRLMYRIRRENRPEELKHFFACMEELGKEKE
ncbi:MAG: glutamyl-tRNA reductase [Lachnospiraceae bacterium]|nr:glutamyl-tRNA reductase [Lachnospiraceae bacterium]